MLALLPKEAVVPHPWRLLQNHGDGFNSEPWVPKRQSESTSHHSATAERLLDGRNGIFSYSTAGTPLPATGSLHLLCEGCIQNTTVSSAP